MRSYANVIQEAELLTAAPEAVAEFLRERAALTKEERRDDRLDEDGEIALAGRHDPRVDLAVARYGKSGKAVASLFQAAPQSSAIRLAALSNAVAGTGFNFRFLGFPVCLFASEAEAAQWTATAPADELQALFENPGLGNSFLTDLLERKKDWASITDDCLVEVVSILTRNPRMWTSRSSTFMDGFDEYTYSAVFNAAWMLSETAPTTERWAAALGWLYEKLLPDAFGLKDPLAAADRWKPEPSDAEALAQQAEQNGKGWLTSRQRIRANLARLALSKNSKLLAEFFAHDDVAYRSAAYRTGQLTTDQMKAAFERDGPLMFEESRENMWLWRRAPHRQELHDIAWAVVQADKHSDLLAAITFNGMRDKVFKQHPEWFADEDPPTDDSLAELPATKADLEAIAQRIDNSATRADLEAIAERFEQPATKADREAFAQRVEQPSEAHAAVLEQLRQLLATMNGKLGWVWWFAFGALVMGVLQRI